MSSTLKVQHVPQTISPYRLTTFSEALEILNDHQPKLGEHEVKLNSIEDCLKVVDYEISKVVLSQATVPGNDESKVEGYIFNSDYKPRAMPFLAKTVDTFEEFEKLKLTKKDESFACAVITGQKLPPQGGYHVIPLEDTEFENDCYIRIMHIPQVEKFVRRKGAEISLEDKLPVGTKIGCLEIAAMLAMRQRSVTVYDKPQAAVLSTGAELIDPFESRPYSKKGIVDIDHIMITMLLSKHGCAVSQDRFSIVSHNVTLITKAMRMILLEQDILVVTGGASMGRNDLVKDAIIKLGGTVHFGRVNMKPGRSTSFSTAVLDGKVKYIFSLPGNPVSAYISCLTLVIPYLCRNSIVSLSKRYELDFDDIFNIRAVVDHICDGPPDGYPLEERFEFLLAQIVGKKDDVYEVHVSIKQQSNRLMSVIDSDCLIFAWRSDNDNSHLKVGRIYKAMKLANGAFCW